MSLYRYFKTVWRLSSPQGTIAVFHKPSAVKNANAAVRSALTPASKSRGAYAKYTPEQQAMIGASHHRLHSKWRLISHVSQTWNVKTTEWCARDTYVISTKGHGQLGRVDAKIKTAKIYSRGNLAFSRKFAPAKISHYMVCLPIFCFWQYYC